MQVLLVVNVLVVVVGVGLGLRLRLRLGLRGGGGSAGRWGSAGWGVLVQDDAGADGLEGVGGVLDPRVDVGGGGCWAQGEASGRQLAQSVAGDKLGTDERPGVSLTDTVFQ